MSTKAQEILSEPLSALKPAEKSKESKPSEIHSRATLFVSRFPFETTSEQLESFFSEIGPVKSCFIIKKDSKSTGCGYVQYALAKDAQRAITELKKKKFDEKRTLKMEIAIKKSVVEERKDGKLY
jgi:nucleolar protein 4